MAGERQARLGGPHPRDPRRAAREGSARPAARVRHDHRCRVTGDLQHASVFYTVLGDAEERDGVGRGAEVGDRDAAHRGGQAPQRAAHPVAGVHPRRDPRERRPHRRLCCAKRASATRPWRGSRRPRTYAGDADPYVKPREFDEADEPTTRTRTSRRRAVVASATDEAEPSTRLSSGRRSSAVGCSSIEPVVGERVDRAVALERVRPVARSARRAARRGPRHPAALSAPRRAPGGRCPRSAPAGDGRRRCRGSRPRATRTRCAIGQASQRGARAVHTVAPSSIVAAFTMAASASSRGQQRRPSRRGRVRDGGPGCDRPSTPARARGACWCRRPDAGRRTRTPRPRARCSRRCR